MTVGGLLQEGVMHIFVELVSIGLYKYKEEDDIE